LKSSQNATVHQVVQSILGLKKRQKPLLKWTRQLKSSITYVDLESTGVNGIRLMLFDNNGHTVRTYTRWTKKTKPPTFGYIFANNWSFTGAFCRKSATTLLPNIHLTSRSNCVATKRQHYKI